MEKYYSSLSDRISKLQKRNITFSINQVREKKILTNYNYYNLVNGYKKPFIMEQSRRPGGISPDDDYYENGTKLEHLESLYIFDENIRILFLKWILTIEERIKHTLVQSFYEIHSSQNSNLHREHEYLRRDYYNVSSNIKYEFTFHNNCKCETIVYPQNSALNNSKCRYYVSKNLYEKTMAEIYRVIAHQREKQEYVKCYLEKHKYLPFWVLTNILTFGTISKLLQIQTDEVKNEIYKSFKLKPIGQKDIEDVDRINLTNAVQILAFFRNKCAHGERFYCEKIKIPLDDNFMGLLGKLPASDKIKTLNQSYNLNNSDRKKHRGARCGIFILMFCMSLFLSKQDFKTFKDSFLQEYLQLINSIPNNSIRQKIKKEMGLDFDWYNNLK